MTTSFSSLAWHSVAVIFALTTLLTMTNGLAKSKRDQLDRVVAEVMRCAQIPAMALTVFDPEDRPAFIKAYGTSDPTSSTRASIDTRFCLGGATQAFTAVLLAKLIQENPNVTWSTPIQDILNKRVVLPDTYRAENINLKDIFAQRSGMPTMDIVEAVSPYSTRRLARSLRYAKPAAGFREKYIPNHVMFSLMEDVFQVLGGDTWENLLKGHILMPLEMNSVLFLGEKDAHDAANVAYPVVFFDGNPQTLSLESLKGLGIVRPAAGLCLSALDMSRWIEFLLHGKAPNTEQIIEPEVLEATFRGIQPRGHSDDPEVVGYRQPNIQVSYSREQNALGWITGHYRGYQFISQDGSVPGYETLATILPTRDVAVFTSFTGNGKKAFAAKVLMNIYSIDTLLRGNTWFTQSDVCQLMSQMTDMHPMKMDTKHESVKRVPRYTGARSLDDYVGYYRNYAFGDVSIRHNETEDLDLLMEYGNAIYKMAPTSTNDTFQLIAKGMLWYSTNADSYSDERIIAVFGVDDRDWEHRTSKLTVTGFDGTRDVIFFTNPGEPEIQGFEDGEPCGAGSMASSVSLLSCLLMSLYVLFR